jgi:hypothetical protein
VPIAQLPKFAQYKYCQWSYGSGDFTKATGAFKPFAPTVGRTDLGDRWGFDAIVYYLLDQQSKRDFYIIKESLGGTAIDTACSSNNGMYWNASEEYLASTAAADKGGKSLLKAFTENIGASIDNVLVHHKGGYKIRAFLWHQGESDKKMAVHYQDNLKKVVAYVRAYLVEKTGNKDYANLPFICGTFSEKSRDRSEQVVQALENLAKEDSHFYVVDASDATIQKDRLHFDAQGAELLGKRVFEKLMEVVGEF